MKKSIKYAGIAAATLLAVAPVAAPVVSQAATTTESGKTAVTDQSVQDAEITKFGNQFGDVQADQLDASTITLGTAQTVAAFEKSAVIKTPTTIDDGVVGKDATVTTTAKYGNTTINQNDLGKILADNTYPEVVFTITLSYNNLAGTAVTKTYTVKATRPADDKNTLTTINATFTDPISVPLNSTTTSTQLTATTGVALKDQNGDGVVPATLIVPDTNYYNTYSQAIDAANDKTVTPAYTAKAEDGTINKFDKSGTYYQAITFNVNSSSSSLGKFLQQYMADANKYTVLVNGKTASKGYDFTTDATATTEGTKVTFVRTVNVAKSTDNWTTSDTTGVVTTKTSSKYYTLKNDDNVTIANRALGANTAWKTDKVRVNQDGVKQYRVATGEWIDADNVVYGENNNNNNGSGLTEIKTVSGVATLTKPAGYFMTLFGDNGKALDNMMLASQTAWRVDRTAKDANGVTYYRVATGEWLQAGEGVSFK